MNKVREVIRLRLCQKAGVCAFQSKANTDLNIAGMLWIYSEIARALGYGPVKTSRTTKPKYYNAHCDELWKNMHNFLWKQPYKL